MGAGEYFRVDIDALTDAGIGIAELLTETEKLAVEDIDCAPESWGHPALAEACASFTERWDVGIASLLTDGNDMSQRMIDAAGAYIEADSEHERRLKGFFDGVDDPGAEAIEQDG
ncbi:hypothetical protein REH65_26830 [Saccharopolyspora sp. ID03-671]|uniref:hypothetical protein n=1 Tax=Saccharopolyspora sp. ID03-671 TaxID=3073066 RepID=UPI0032474691